MYDFQRYRGYFWMVIGGRIALPSILIPLAMVNIVDDPKSKVVSSIAIPLVICSVIGIGLMSAGFIKLRQQIPQLRSVGRVTPAMVQLMPQVRRDIFRLNIWRSSKDLFAASTKDNQGNTRALRLHRVSRLWVEWSGHALGSGIERGSTLPMLHRSERSNMDTNVFMSLTRRAAAHVFHYLSQEMGKIDGWQGD